MKTYNLYLLKDPTNGDIKYIGYTKNSLSQRLEEHIYEGKRCVLDGKKRYHYYKAFWVRSLLLKNLIPIIELIKTESDINKIKQSEILFIKKFKDLGYKLTNLTPGGDGNSSPSKETKDKIRMSLLGNKDSDETKLNKSKASKGKKKTIEHSLNISIVKKKKVKQIDLTSKEVIRIFNSAKEAALELTGKTTSHIGDVCNKNRPCCLGFYWEWK